MSATTVPAGGLAVESAPTTVRKPPGPLRVALSMWRTRVGLIITAVLVLVAFFGRYFAPYGEKELIGIKLKPASQVEGTKFGTDYLGQDVWTRFLYGGRPILIAAVLATAIALVLGTAVGLIAAYNRGRLDDVLMRIMDLLLAFPQIILALLVISMVQPPKTYLIILTVGISTVPRIARVVRGTAVSVVERDFVSAAEALGESRPRILFSELLPNVAAPLLVEANLRLTFSIGVISGIAFLGLTPDPQQANWGLMVQQNRAGLQGIQAWGTLLPVLAIALLTIGTGLIGDGLSRAAAGVDRKRAD